MAGFSVFEMASPDLPQKEQLPQKSPLRSISNASHMQPLSSEKDLPETPSNSNKDRKVHSIETLTEMSATLPANRQAHLVTTGKQVLHAWRNNKFCDVIIKADHSLFYAHLEVFVAFTDYFDEIPVERKQQQINLGNVRPDDCATVLKYLYFGELQANAENIYGVWTIATALRVRDIIEPCALFIERLLTPLNLIYVLEFCEAKNTADLYSAAYERFVLTFYEQTTDEHFLQWKIDQVARLIGCDDIIVKSELDVYVAMKRWIDHRRPERIHDLEDLIEYVRFAHMTRDELVQCTLLDPSYLDIRKVKELLATANWYITMQQSGRHWSEFQLPKPRHPPRKQLSAEKMLSKERDGENPRRTSKEKPGKVERQSKKDCH